MNNKQIAWFGFLLLAVTWPVVENYLRFNEWRMRFKHNVQFMPSKAELEAQEFNVVDYARN
jgi:hypothetical protein